MQPVLRNDYYLKYSRQTRPDLRSVRPLNSTGGGETLRWKPVLTQGSPSPAVTTASTTHITHSMPMPMPNNLTRLNSSGVTLNTIPSIDGHVEYGTGQVDVFRLVAALFGLSLYVGIPAAGLVYVGLRFVG